jgi:hypothetical protein
MVQGAGWLHGFPKPFLVGFRGSGLGSCITKAIARVQCFGVRVQGLGGSFEVLRACVA